MKQEIQSNQSGEGTGRSRYLFPVGLAIATIAGLLIRWYIARKTYIDFDEWQHLFMAGTPRWTDLFFELRTNAHPALFFLLLRGIVWLGNVALYRAISVAAGTGSILMVGLIARRILSSPMLQALCVFAFALSASAIMIAVEIRSYQLTVFLTLLAFSAWLMIFPLANGQTSVRSCIVFAICTSLAVFSHYSAVFFLGASIATPLIAGAMFPRIRERWISGMRTNTIWWIFAAFALPCAVFAVEYFVHIRRQLMLGADPEFYRGGTPGETVEAFLLRNSHNFFNLFSPIEVHNTALFLATLVIVGAAAGWVFFRKSRVLPGAGATAAAPIVLAAVMVLEIMTASLARKYPFGGLLRHQYIAGPFLLIAAFVFLDALVSISGSVSRRAIPVLLTAALVVNLAVQWPSLIVYPGAVLLQDEYDSWRAAFGDRRAVYLDHWSVIGFFIHTSTLPRHFVRRIADAARIDQYALPDGTQIFYDKTRDNLDLSDASVYQSFAACLRGSGVHELSLFFFSAGNRPLNQLPHELEESIIEKASEQGLIATKVLATRTSVFAGFRLRND